MSRRWALVTKLRNKDWGSHGVVCVFDFVSRWRQQDIPVGLILYVRKPMKCKKAVNLSGDRKMKGIGSCGTAERMAEFLQKNKSEWCGYSFALSEASTRVEPDEETREGGDKSQLYARESTPLMGRIIVLSTIPVHWSQGDDDAKVAERRRTKHFINFTSMEICHRVISIYCVE